MKTISIAIGAAAALTFAACSKTEQQTNKSNLYAMNETTPTTIYNFKATDLMGAEFDFATLKGKRLLIVNTASKCGFTSQYKGLQELYTKYGGENFEIIGFPSNDFGNQEPGTSEEIASFCEQNYGVSFAMMEKVAVKGKEMHPIYQWLTKKELNGQADASVAWNFHKFLIDEHGNWAGSFGSTTSPTSDKIVRFAAGK